MSLVISEKSTNLSFLNYESVLNNMDAVIDFHCGENVSKGISKDKKKQYFMDTLNALQRTEIPFENNKIKLIFESETLCNYLLENKLIDKEDTIDNKHIYSFDERNILIYKTEKAIDLIKLLHPGLYSLITKHIGTIFFAKKEGFGGGSVSSLLGLIWFSPSKKWSIIDYAENLYHEFIHNSLFLDDMVNCIFPDPTACMSEEALTTSTILKIKRPLDKSFHAANVSIGVMHLYHLLGDEKKSRLYEVSLKKTISELNERQQFLGDKGLEILNEMNHFLKYFDFESITDSLKEVQ